MKDFFSILVFILCSGSSLYAQVYYPVVARMTQTPPYAAYFSDYSNPAQTNLTIQIQQNDAAISSRAIRLKLLVEGQGYLIESTDVVQGEPSLILNYGQIYNLSSVEVANYFKQYNLKISPTQYGKPLSEGVMKFGVQVLDYLTNRPLSGVQWGAPVWITLNDPPVWIMPEKEAEIIASPSPNVAFQWAPRHTNVSDVVYEFTLKELVYNTYSMGNLQNVFLSQPTFYQTRTTTNSLVYNATMPPLVEGRIYAYRVRAIAKRGMEEVGVFKNNGFSEVQALFYGAPMLPVKAPVITGLSRDELTNVTVLDWKAEPNHSLFTVAYREKNATGSWVGEQVNPILGATLHTYTFNRLDPSKSYEIRVGAEDKYKQSAYSQSVFLDSLTLDQAKEVTLTGKVMWAFTEGEEGITDNSSLLATQTSSGRTSSEIKPLGSPGSKRHALANARISIVSSESEELSFDGGQTYQIIKTITTDQNGAFSYLTDNLKLLKDLKNIYIIAESNAAPFNKIIRKIGAHGTLKTQMDLGELVLTAASVRYSPKIVPVNASANLEFEEVGLYRLGDVVAQNPFLTHEGNDKSVNMQYNGRTFVKVADYLQSSVVGSLFANSHFNDYFLLKIKEKGKKEVLMPVNGIPAAQSILHITDYFNYSPLAYTIEGIVKKGANLVSDATVQAFGRSVLTDENGYYLIEIPQSAVTGAVVDIKVIDPLSTNNFTKESLVFNAANIKKDFSLHNQAFYIEAQVVDTQNVPAAGATVLIGNQLLKTDQNGWFSTNGLSTTLPATVRIRRDGYSDLDIPIAQFKKSVLTANDEQRAFEAMVRSPEIGDKGRYYQEQFTSLGWVCSELYSSEPIILSKTYHYRLITFKEKTSGFLNMVNLADSAEYISAHIKVNDLEVHAPQGKALYRSGVLNGTGGYVGSSLVPFLKINTLNASGQPVYVEEELLFNFPENAGVNDTITFLVQLKEGVVFNGVVMDSTIYIEGLHVPGTVKKAGETLNRVAGATIELGGSKALSDDQGRFKMIVPIRRELLFELSKPGFLKTFTHMATELSNNYKTIPKDFYMLQLDTNAIPVLKTLMGFEVMVDRIVVNTSDVTNDSSIEKVLAKGNRTYKISGALVIGTESKNNYKVDKSLALKFNEVIVRMESKGSNNAVLVYDDAKLTETQIKTKLFGYAPVSFSAGGQYPQIRLAPMRGESGQGLIVSTSMAFTQSKMAGLEFGQMKLENTDEEASKLAEKDGFRLVFSSLPLQSLNEDMAYKIIFPSTVSKTALTAEGIDATSGPYYQAPFAATNISGIYSAFNMYVNHESSILTKNGINLDGYFAFPKIWKFQSEGALDIKSMSVNKNFALEKIEFAKGPKSKNGEIAKFSVANRWVLFVNSLVISNNFSEFGFTGQINTDKDNFLVIKNMSLASSGGQYYPDIKLATSSKGLTFKSMKFTTPTGKVISFSRSMGDGEYEVSAALKMEFVSSAGGTLGNMAKKVFPLEVQTFEWSTGGKFLIAIAAKSTIEIGPVGLNVRRILYTKGASIGKDAINGYLKLSDAEAQKLFDSGKFNDTRKKLTEKERAARDAISVDALYVRKLTDEVAAEDPAANWAIGFAGGVNVNSSAVKGITFKSDLSFVIGDFGSGVELMLNEIDMSLSSSGFKASGKLKIVMQDDKRGFEGAVEVETAKIKFAGTFKFYQLYYVSSGNKKGMELGASILTKSAIPMGSITWTTIGGGFDLNTAEGTYKFFFKGSAINTTIPKNLIEYRTISVLVAFNTKECDALPLIKGTMSLYVNDASFCNGSIELDFCNLRVLGKVDCEKELEIGIKGKINATIVASKEGFLVGSAVSIQFMGLTRNATFALGIGFNTVSTSAKEVSMYVDNLPGYLKNSDNKTFSGIYFNYTEKYSLKSSGEISLEIFDLVAYKIEIAMNFSLHMGVNFNNGNFIIKSETNKTSSSVPVGFALKYKVTTVKIGSQTMEIPVLALQPVFKQVIYEVPTVYFYGRAEVLGYGLTGTLSAYFNFEGGRTFGYYLTASARATVEVFNDTGADFKCNRVNLKFSKNKVLVYPCGIKCSARWDFWNSCSVKWCDVNMSLPNFKDGIGVKACISGGFKILYTSGGLFGAKGGWSFSIN